VRLNRHVISSEKKKKDFFKVSEKKKERVVEFEGLGFQIYCVRARARARKKRGGKGIKLLRCTVQLSSFFFSSCGFFCPFFFKLRVSAILSSVREAASPHHFFVRVQFIYFFTFVYLLGFSEFMFALVQQVASPLYFYSFQNLSSAPASQSPVLFSFGFALPPNSLYVCPSPLSQHVFFFPFTFCVLCPSAHFPFCLSFP
jgi:hypothetical protein